MKLTDKQVANIAFIQQLEIPLTQKDEEQIDLIFTDTKANVRQIKITKNEQQRICLSYSHEDLHDYRWQHRCCEKQIVNQSVSHHPQPKTFDHDPIQHCKD